MGVRYEPVSGKTYTLFGDDSSPDRYFSVISSIADSLLAVCPDQEVLLLHVQMAGGARFRKRASAPRDDALIALIRERLGAALHQYTRAAKEHLKSLPFPRKFDSIIGMREEGYHLYMLEIELVNRLYRDAFRKSSYKFALLPHCLRDFRPRCCAAPGEIEYVCRGCTEDCFIRMGSELLKRYDIHPYISITIDQERLFKRLKAEHPDIGALGIACIPELVQGMRLCIRLGIPPVGIPLNANRCARWMKQARESSFSLEELEGLLR
jgi:hypothetical protein